MDPKPQRDKPFTVEEFLDGNVDVWDSDSISGPWGSAKVMSMVSPASGPFLMIAVGPDCAEFVQRAIRLKELQSGALIIVETADDPAAALEAKRLSPLVDEVDEIIIAQPDVLGWYRVGTTRRILVAPDQVAPAVIQSICELDIVEAETAERLTPSRSKKTR